MALKKDVTILDDILITMAYFKILHTKMNWEAMKITFVLGCWKSKAAYNNHKPQLPVEILEQIGYEPEPFNESPIFIRRFPNITLDLPDGSEIGTKADQYTLIKTMVPFFADAENAAEN